MNTAHRSPALLAALPLALVLASCSAPSEPAGPDPESAAGPTASSTASSTAEPTAEPNPESAADPAAKTPAPGAGAAAAQDTPANAQGNAEEDAEVLQAADEALQEAADEALGLMAGVEDLGPGWRVSESNSKSFAPSEVEPTAAEACTEPLALLSGDQRIFLFESIRLGYIYATEEGQSDRHLTVTSFPALFGTGLLRSPEAEGLLGQFEDRARECSRITSPDGLQDAWVELSLVDELDDDSALLLTEHGPRPGFPGTTSIYSYITVVSEDLLVITELGSEHTDGESLAELDRVHHLEVERARAALDGLTAYDELLEAA
ncbi:hypothetical protein GCM10022377_28430 [Zhihengliuella alba]|uniref:Sensor domain-containing protein n=1 Tax=Zhihengliuella alba TaxID=547018 RepID=A0ABP7E1Z3_9MICC